MDLYLNGRVAAFGLRAWQKARHDSRYYVVFAVRPAYAPHLPRLAVVDDYGNLTLVGAGHDGLIYARAL